MADLLIVAVVLGLPTLALCVVAGRYNSSAVAREWEMVMAAGVEARVNDLDAQCALDRAMAESAWRASSGARLDADITEAKRLMGVAYGVLERATPDRLLRLRGMAICARMAVAFVPVVALRPADFRLAGIATLAGLAQLTHHVLVGGGERFVLRVHIIALGFRLAVRAMRVARNGETAADALTFDAARLDWGALDREHLNSLRALLRSLSATRRTREVVSFP